MTSSEVRGILTVSIPAGTNPEHRSKSFSRTPYPSSAPTSAASTPGLDSETTTSPLDDPDLATPRANPHASFSVPALGGTTHSAFFNSISTSGTGSVPGSSSNVHIMTAPPPLQAIKFAPLPELAPRKRKNQTPLGIAARGQMMARRRAMLSGSLANSQLTPQQQQYYLQQQALQQQGQGAQVQYAYTEDQNMPGDEEEMEDPFVALGRMVKGVWRKVSQKDLKEKPSVDEKEKEKEKDVPETDGDGKTKKKKKGAGEKEKSATSPNGTEKLKKKDPSSPISSKKKPTSPHRASALVVADEADTAGAIAPILHGPEDAAVPAENESTGSNDDSSSNNDTNTDDDDNWQTATIRPGQDVNGRQREESFSSTGSASDTSSASNSAEDDGEEELSSAKTPRLRQP